MEVRTELFPLFYRIENESFSRIAFKYFLTNFLRSEKQNMFTSGKNPYGI